MKSEQLAHEEEEELGARCRDVRLCEAAGGVAFVVPPFDLGHSVVHTAARFPFSARSAANLSSAFPLSLPLYPNVLHLLV